MQGTSASATASIPVFNGEDGQFPFFKTRLVAAVCGLGGHYHAAMEGLPPYDNCTDTSNMIMHAEPLQDASERQINRDASKKREERETRCEAGLSSGYRAGRAYGELPSNVKTWRHIFSILISSIGEEPLKLTPGTCAGERRNGSRRRHWSLKTPMQRI